MDQSEENKSDAFKDRFQAVNVLKLRIFTEQNVSLDIKSGSFI